MTGVSFVAVEEVAVEEAVHPAAVDGVGSGESVQPNAVVVLSDELIALARAAAVDEAGTEAGVGDYLGARAEDAVATSAAFATTDRGYRGWYWLVTLAVVDAARPTISEVVLLPGEGALLAPAWVPWDQRVRAGDLGVGDLLPTAPEDDRLVPGYLDSDDPAVREVEYEFGFGRVRVLGRLGRDDAAARWHDGPFGPSEPMAQQAPAACATCGFYIRLEGLLGQAFGACTNELSPADGRVVDAAFGCGAHSETVVDAPLISATTAVVMDELTLEVHARPVTAQDPPAAEEAAPAEGAAPAEEAGPAEVDLEEEAGPAEADRDEVSAAAEPATGEHSMGEPAPGEVGTGEAAELGSNEVAEPPADDAPPAEPTELDVPTELGVPTEPTELGVPTELAEPAESTEPAGS